MAVARLENIGHTFLKKLPPHLPFESYFSNFKNHHLPTFPLVESDVSIVRPPRLLWKTDMIMRKVAQKYFMSWEATEIF